MAPKTGSEACPETRAQMSDTCVLNNPPTILVVFGLRKFLPAAPNRARHAPERKSHAAAPTFLRSSFPRRLLDPPRGPPDPPGRRRDPPNWPPGPPPRGLRRPPKRPPDPCRELKQPERTDQTKQTELLESFQHDATFKATNLAPPVKTFLPTVTIHKKQSCQRVIMSNSPPSQSIFTNSNNFILNSCQGVIMSNSPPVSTSVGRNRALYNAQYYTTDRTDRADRANQTTPRDPKP